MNKETELQVEMHDNFGIALSPGNGVITFELSGVEDREGIMQKQYRSIYSEYMNENASVSLEGGFFVPIWGDMHNLYPQEVFQTIYDNKLLPEVIDKQIKMLFAKGLYLFKEQIVGEGKDSQKIRVPVQDLEIQYWMDTWDQNGFETPTEYCHNLIKDFYLVETCVSQYFFNASRRIGGKLPVRALRYIGADTARKASDHPVIGRKFKDADCKFIAVGDYICPRMNNFEIFNRFDPANPFKFNTAISWVNDKTFTRDVYSLNHWFKGLLDWIKASNLNPRYINSYLKNALNAHVHVIIPGSWYEAQKNILKDICTQNLMGESLVQKEYKGVKLYDDVAKKPIEFYETMLDQLIRNELRDIAKCMSGEGKNQGKMWASTKWGDDGWSFEEFPGKFKEYLTAITDYDKRCDFVILAGMGMPPSISNVVPEGSTGTSGNDIYYTNMLYDNNLTLLEYYILKDFNRALQLNFQQCRGANGTKIGFLIEIPKKMQDTTPSQRMQNTAGNGN